MWMFHRQAAWALVVHLYNSCEIIVRYLYLWMCFHVPTIAWLIVRLPFTLTVNLYVRSPGRSPGRSTGEHDPLLTGVRARASRGRRSTADAPSTVLSERLQAVQGEMAGVLAAQVSRSPLPTPPSDVQDTGRVSGLLIHCTVLRIRDRFEFFHPGSATKNLIMKYLTLKLIRSSRKYNPGWLFRIQDPDFFPSRVLDPGVKKATDPDRQHW